MDDDREKIILQSKKNHTSLRMVTTMQEKRNRKKICVLFTVHISSEKGKDIEDVEVLRRYRVFQ